MATDTTKGGRPTSYDESYCEQLIEHCSEGLSFESFAGEIRVSRDTLYEWRKVHPEFSDAAKIAKECCRNFWENKGRDGTIGDLEKFNSGSWQFIMKNFFREEWSDTFKNELSGEMPIQYVAIEGFKGFGDKPEE